MAVPTLTPEQRAQALEKAKAARAQRAKIREDLKSGNTTVAEVLEKRDDPIIGKMKVYTMIEALPNYGKAKAQKVMEELKIAESRRLAGLGDRQVEALLAKFN